MLCHAALKQPSAAAQQPLDPKLPESIAPSKVLCTVWTGLQCCALMWPWRQCRHAALVSQPPRLQHSSVAAAAERSEGSRQAVWWAPPCCWTSPSQPSPTTWATGWRCWPPCTACWRRAPGALARQPAAACLPCSWSACGARTCRQAPIPFAWFRVGAHCEVFAVSWPWLGLCQILQHSCSLSALLLVSLRREDLQAGPHTFRLVQVCCRLWSVCSVTALARTLPQSATQLQSL